MKARMAAAVICAALAGCSECSDMRYELADKAVVASPQSARSCFAAIEKPGKEKRAGESWGIGKMLKAAVHDSDGNQVAEIDDLLVSPEGRINTAILTVKDGDSETRTITVPFRELKRSVDANGNYMIRTSLLPAPKKRAPAKNDGK